MLTEVVVNDELSCNIFLKFCLTIDDLNLFYVLEYGSFILNVMFKSLNIFYLSPFTEFNDFVLLFLFYLLSLLFFSLFL